MTLRHSSIAIEQIFTTQLTKVRLVPSFKILAPTSASARIVVMAVFTGAKKVYGPPRVCSRKIPEFRYSLHNSKRQSLTTFLIGYYWSI